MKAKYGLGRRTYLDRLFSCDSPGNEDSTVDREVSASDSMHRP
jgi:hypothetical protein